MFPFWVRRVCVCDQSGWSHVSTCGCITFVCAFCKCLIFNLASFVCSFLLCSIGMEEYCPCLPVHWLVHGADSLDDVMFACLPCLLFQIVFNGTGIELEQILKFCSHSTHSIAYLNRIKGIENSVQPAAAVGADSVGLLCWQHSLHNNKWSLPPTY